MLERVNFIRSFATNVNVVTKKKPGRLPEVKLTVFKDNFEEWETFWSSFQTNVDVRDDLEKTTKFIYLVQSLEGEPKEMINGLAITDDNYNVALYILRDHYANASKQTSVLMQKFHTMPTPKHNPKDLRVFLTEYRKIKHQLSRVLDFRQSELVIKSIVVRKLPFETSDRICDIYVTHDFTLDQMETGIQHIVDVTHPLYESRMRWIPDPMPSPPRCAEQEFPVPLSDSIAPIPSDSVRSRDIRVSVRKTSDNQASAITTSVLSGAPLTPSLPKKCRRRRRRQARRAANQNRAPSSAAPVTPDERWANGRAGRSGATQPRLEDSDPTSRMRTAVYPDPSIHFQTITQPPISTANKNSVFPLGLELGEFPGLYKPAVPDPRHDSTARPFRVNNSGSSLSSPPHLQPYSKPFSGQPARPYMTCPTREAGGSSEAEVWNHVSAAAARPTPGYQRRHRRRPSRSSRCWTSGPDAHGCRDWDHQPAADRAFFKETRFQEALQKVPP